ncbi:hypothetical protein ACFLSZ_05655 [Candidatus Bipolaricaulota bacterium]
MRNERVFETETRRAAWSLEDCESRTVSHFVVMVDHIMLVSDYETHLKRSLRTLGTSRGVRFAVGGY